MYERECVHCTSLDSFYFSQNELFIICRQRLICWIWMKVFIIKCHGSLDSRSANWLLLNNYNNASKKSRKHFPVLYKSCMTNKVKTEKYGIVLPCFSESLIYRRWSAENRLRKQEVREFSSLTLNFYLLHFALSLPHTKTMTLKEKPGNAEA